MIRPGLYCFLLIVMCFLVFGCSKDNKNLINPVTSSLQKPAVQYYVFANNLTTSVRVNIYKNVNDYNSDNNLFITLHIPSGTLNKIPFTSLDTNATYYVDWYSDDYLNTNWLTFSSNPGRMTPRRNDTLFPILTPPHFGLYRPVVLSGYKTQSSWKAYDAYDYSHINIWGAISANTQYRMLSLNKDMTAVYTYKDASGNVVTQNFSYDFAYPADNYVHAYFSPASSNIDSFDNRSSLIASGPLPARDTIVLRCNDGYFMMAKQ